MKFTALVPELIVTDIDRSTNFYVNILGFKIEYSRPEEKFQFLTFNGAQIMLLEDNENEHSRTGPLEFPRGQGVNLSIVTPDVSSMVKVLDKNDYPVRIPVREQWHRQDKVEHGERQLWVMDPDGYLLRFIENLGTRDETA